jgi:predicted RNase H-like HicB family nuclease
MFNVDMAERSSRCIAGTWPRHLGRRSVGSGTSRWREMVGVKDKQRFRVTVRQDPEEHSAWLVNLVGAPGAQTFGRSLTEAKRHGVEAVALWLELEPDDFEIDWDIRLGKLATPVRQARTAMAHAEADRERRDDAVRALTGAGLSYRDIADLLGLSHQRVAQISSCLVGGYGGR